MRVAVDSSRRVSRDSKRYVHTDSAILSPGHNVRVSSSQHVSPRLFPGSGSAMMSIHGNLKSSDLVVRTPLNKAIRGNGGAVC